MCTVTFVPAGAGFYLTSNRDGSRDCGLAVAPHIYRKGTNELIYPRDKDGGGSWIVMKEEGTAAVLLNDAFLKHFRKPPYRVSRGVVLLDIVGATEPLRHFEEIDLNGIEPFTLVLLVDGDLWDCRWAPEVSRPISTTPAIRYFLPGKNLSVTGGYYSGLVLSMRSKDRFP